MAKFFQPFPVVEYNDTLCKNITQRTALSESVRKQYTAFYDVVLQDGDRPDIIAHKAYNDQYYDWVVYYSNGIVDPYHGWFLSEKDFNKFIINKYGSLAEAVERISHYRVKSSTDTIDPTTYQSLLPKRKKYWSANLDDAGRILDYKRTAADWKVATNALVRLTAALNETRMTEFQIGEHVTQTVGGVIVAAGDVVRVTGTTIEVQHITGTFVVGNVVGMTSDTVAAVGEVLALGVSIQPDELVYWEPVTFFTHEQELNEQRRSISLLLPNVATQTVRAHEDILSKGDA